MYFYILFLNTLYFPSVLAQNCPEKGISSHKILNENGYRLATMKKGNYTIQGLMTFTRKDCKTVSADGLVRAYGMKYSIDKANEDNSSLFTHHVSIGYHLDNLCFDVTKTMARGIELVSLYRPNSICRSDFLKCDPKQNISYYVKPAVGIVGTLRSVTSIPLAGLLALYQIPQVSYSASSRILSKKSLYKSFFRTVPSDTNQIKVMLDIMGKFDWNYVFAIGSDDDYGKLGVAELKHQSHGRNICVTNDEYVAYDSQDKRIDDIIEKIRKNIAKVVVLFCYATPIGVKILQKAQQKGIKRVWLTSESWNPYALKLNVSKTQKVGILTVSLKTYTAPYLDEYIKREIVNNFECDMWLQNYMNNTLRCLPTHLSTDRLSLHGDGQGCPVSIVDIMKKLSGSYGAVQNLVDAVTSLIHAIKNYLRKVCSDSSVCSVDIINPEDLTKEMKNVNFTNQQGNSVSFDEYGNPKHAFYSIENIQLVNTTYKYIPVGNWSSARNDTKKLEMDVDNIKWPLWFSSTKRDVYPFSRCNRDCEPGWRVVGKQLCCWKCQKCCGNTISNITNALSCTTCGNETTEDHVNCRVTPIKWLTIYDKIGMSIIIISGIGFLITFISTCLLLYYRDSLVMESSLTFVLFCSVLLHVTFAYGGLHIIKPSEIICPAVNSIFFLLLMLYISIVMIKVKFFSNNVIGHIGKLTCGRFVTAQLLSIIALFSIEAASVITWFNIEKGQTGEIDHHSEVTEIILSCEVRTSAGWYVSLFIPISFLLVASYWAFCERNDDHFFHEPKFLSFTCIALCIIIIAYIPTYGYAVGQNKALIAAVTMDLFAFTFISCLIIPRVHVSRMVHNFGVDRFPLCRENALPQKSDNIISRISVAMADPIGRKLKETKNHLAPIKEAVSPVEGKKHVPHEKSNAIKRTGEKIKLSSVKGESVGGTAVTGYVNDGVDQELDNVD